MREKFSRRRLPHWDQPGATYFVTTCLLNSIPAQGLLDIDRARHGPRPGLTTASCVDEVQRWKSVFAATEAWLDCKPAGRYLADERLAGEVVSSLKYFAGHRYDLIAWVVMPSHLHWVFRPRHRVQNLGSAEDDRSPRQRIGHSVNRQTARVCNRLLGRKGGFWQRESYDRCVRDEEELERIVAYIHANPVRAGLVDRLEDFKFSSAREHALKEAGVAR